VKKFKQTAAQGDIYIRRIEKLPNGTKAVERNGKVIVAHSETGHHHSIHDKRVTMHASADPFICYLQVEGRYADLVHERPFDTHETIRLAPGCYEIRRQEEFTPEGWRMVQD
jgi:hypothetical protein